MRVIRLIHWKADEIGERVRKLRDAGYAVSPEPLVPGMLKEWRVRPPAAVVIDLSRLPSHGRDVGLALRENKGTRFIPLVFVDGEPEKVERVKRHLPDAMFATWRGIRGALAQAIAQPPVAPLVPRSRLDGYSGTPLPKKLGIKAGSVVALVGAPDDFESTLGDLPSGATLRRRHRGPRDLTIWFTTSKADFTRRLEGIKKLLGNGGLWIAWPKKTSRPTCDLSQNEVRQIGLAAGLVDYKVCAIDDTWAALKFTRRK